MNVCVQIVAAAVSAFVLIARCAHNVNNVRVWTSATIAVYPRALRATPLLFSTNIFGASAIYYHRTNIAASVNVS